MKFLKKNSHFIFVMTILISVSLFIMGIISPILHIKKEVFWFTYSSDDIYLWDSIRIFWDDGNYFLGGIIFLFTLLFPIIKYAELTTRGTHILNINAKTRNVLKKLDKWSMLDVFIIALLIFIFKMDSSFVQVNLKSGTLYFGISILLRMTASELFETHKIHKYKLII